MGRTLVVRASLATLAKESRLLTAIDALMTISRAGVNPRVVIVVAMKRLIAIDAARALGSAGLAPPRSRGTVVVAATTATRTHATNRRVRAECVAALKRIVGVAVVAPKTTPG